MKNDRNKFWNEVNVVTNKEEAIELLSKCPYAKIDKSFYTEEVILEVVKRSPYLVNYLIEDTNIDLLCKAINTYPGVIMFLNSNSFLDDDIINKFIDSIPDIDSKDKLIDCIKKQRLKGLKEMIIKNYEESIKLLESKKKCLLFKSYLNEEELNKLMNDSNAIMDEIRKI